MLLEQLREIVWKCNLELPKNDLVKMTSGNVSGRDRETGLVVIKPSGFSYDEMLPEHMVVVDLSGRVIEGDHKPSVDTDTHLYVYQRRPDVFGMAHTHSPYATSFAVLGQPIPACLTTCALLGGEVPLGGYAPIGGAEIGQEIIDNIGRALAIVMQNHGVHFRKSGNCEVENSRGSFDLGGHLRNLHPGAKRICAMELLQGLADGG